MVKRIRNTVIVTTAILVASPVGAAFATRTWE